MQLSGSVVADGLDVGAAEVASSYEVLSVDYSRSVGADMLLPLWPRRRLVFEEEAGRSLTHTGCSVRRCSPS